MSRVPVPLMAVGLGVLVGGLIVLISGANPFTAYWQIVVGALAPRNLPDTLNWAVPLIGMTLAAALPLRGGMINLGGDGQLAIGGLVAAVVPLYVSAPGPLVIALSILLAMIAAGLYAGLSAWGETRFGVPMLVSSLLLGYLAVGTSSYLVGFVLRDASTGLAQTRMIGEGSRLLAISGPLNIGAVMMLLTVIAVVFVDRCSVTGYELRMRGQNPRFTAYGGVSANRQLVGTMFASGAIAGLVAAIGVLGTLYRYQDGALLTPGYTWSGLMAAMLSRGEPLGAVAAGMFFAALQTGGFAMQRETQIPRVLTMVLQAVIILLLALREGAWRKRFG